MASALGAADLLARVTALLDATGIPYMLTGSACSPIGNGRPKLREGHVIPPFRPRLKGTPAR